MALFRNDSDQPLEIPAADLHVAPHASFVVTEDWVVDGLAAQPLVTRLDDGTAPATGPADADEPAPAAPADPEPEPEPAANAAAPAAAPIEVDAAEGDETVHDFTA